MKTIFDKVFKLAKDSRDSRNLILNSIIKTPCLRSRLKLDEGSELYFKAENFQYTGSFKLRGALSKIKKVEKSTKLITASSGNHGIACSHAAKVTGHNLTVVLPEKVSKSKLQIIKGYGTKIILNSGDSGLAEKHARSLAENGEFDYISPYNDIDIIAGQGTIGFELLEQLPKIDNVYISRRKRRASLRQRLQVRKTRLPRKRKRKRRSSLTLLLLVKKRSWKVSFPRHTNQSMWSLLGRHGGKNAVSTNLTWLKLLKLARTKSL